MKEPMDTQSLSPINDLGTKQAELTPSKPLAVADLIVAYLEQLGIEYVFGIPGGAIEPLYDALARSERRGHIRHILTRHESGAAAMADGYARETGKIGVCCGTSGPGATNLITGVACAYDNNIPMLVLTGQPPLPAFGRNPLQESSCTGINTLGMFKHCTRYNSLVSHPDQIESKLITALQRATRTPRGPSHLSIPLDVFRSISPFQGNTYQLNKLLTPSSLVDNDAVEQLFDTIQRSKKIVLLIGGWCGEATSTILQFARLKNCHIVTTPDGKGLINPRHPLFKGVFGFGGHTSAEITLKEIQSDPSNADDNYIIAVGASMGEWNSGGWCDSVLNKQLIHIDESEENLSHTPMASLHVRGRILSIFNKLNQLLQTQQPADSINLQELACLDQELPQIIAEPDKFLSDAIPIKPQRLMRELGRLLPANTRFLADTGNSVSWATHYLHGGNNRRLGERREAGSQQRISLGRRETDAGWLRVTMNFAAMGWAIGASVGTAIANPIAPVVCITGDGSMLMNGQEISVAVAEELTVIFVVLNDQALGMVKHGQRLAGAEQIGCDLPPTDFAMLARSLGAEAHTIKSADDLQALDMESICQHPGPTLLDVIIDPLEVPPMNVRMRTLMHNL